MTAFGVCDENSGSTLAVAGVGIKYNTRTMYRTPRGG